MARSYQGLVNLKHRRSFLRVVYAALREGRVLCSGDLAFALSGCGETDCEVRAFLYVYVCVSLYDMACVVIEGALVGWVHGHVQGYSVLPSFRSSPGVPPRFHCC